MMRTNIDKYSKTYVLLVNLAKQALKPQAKELQAKREKGEITQKEMQIETLCLESLKIEPIDLTTLVVTEEIIKREDSQDTNKLSSSTQEEENMEMSCEMSSSFEQGHKTLEREHS